MWGGPKYAIGGGVNGYSVKEGDWEKMGKRIIALLKNKSLRAKFGDNGRHIVVEKFSWNKVSERYGYLVGG